VKYTLKLFQNVFISCVTTALQNRLLSTFGPHGFAGPPVLVLQVLHGAVVMPVASAKALNIL